MIDQLPEGKSIGWIQAPLEWIFSHTVRFVGVVRVVIQDGEGFILIRKGKPLVYYFKHIRIELRGNTAREYFKSRPILEFNLCKYTPEEFSRALKICNFEEVMPETEGMNEQVLHPPAPESGMGKNAKDDAGLKQPERESMNERSEKPEPVAEIPTPVREIPDPVTELTSLIRRKPVAEIPTPVREIPDPVTELTSLIRRKPVAEITTPVRDTPDPVTELTSLVRRKPVAEIPTPVREIPEPEIKKQELVADTAATADSGSPLVAETAEVEDLDLKVIGQIKKLNGIVAISVFNDDRNILHMGDAEIEPLLEGARSMLATTKKITPPLDWGSFVQMTLQIPEGNVIIAPYQENHLCILTTKTINIGHIRRILRNLQQD